MSEDLIRRHEEQERLEDARLRLMEQENVYVIELVEDLEYHIEKMNDALLGKEWEVIPPKFLDQLYHQCEKAWAEYHAIEEEIRDSDVESRLLKIEMDLENIDE